MLITSNFPSINRHHPTPTLSTESHDTFLSTHIQFQTFIVHPCLVHIVLGICRVSALSRDPPSNDPPDLLIATKVGLVLPPHKPTHVHTLQCRHRSSSSFCHGLCVSHLHLICTRYTHHLLTRPYLKHSWYSHPIELSRMTSSFQ